MFPELMPKSHVSPLTRAALADRIEADAWRAMMRVAPLALGLAVDDHGGATLLCGPKLPLGLFNRVIGLGSRAGSGPSEVDRAIAYFRAANAQLLWIHVSPGPRREELVAALAARGFRAPARPSWAKMLRGAAPPPEIATPFEVREVGVEHAAELAAALVAAHGMPAPIGAWIEAMVGSPGYRAFAAFDGARVVAGAFLHQHGDCAWLGLGGTLESHRRRGAQGALMSCRIRAAIAAGARHIATETGEPIGAEQNPSLANMFRCGFEQVASRLNFELELGGDS